MTPTRWGPDYETDNVRNCLEGRRRDTNVEHRGYRIIPKLDFSGNGFWIEGKWVKEGLVVIHGEGHEFAGCNAMPGATWFRSVEAARDAIDYLIQADGNAEAFWERLNQDYIVGPELASSTVQVTPLAVEGSEGKLP